jgi:hypothetical protein
MSDTVKKSDAALAVEHTSTHNSRSYVQVSQWLRCCATNRKVAGSIPDDVIGIFH